MRENTNLRVNMIEILNYSCPFIEVTYTNRDGKKRQGLMMIDSCSSVNHLMGKFANEVKTEPAKKKGFHHNHLHWQHGEKSTLRIR